MARFERYLVQANRWLLIVLLAVMVAIVFANVVMRYLLGASVIWSEEVARHLMIWLTFLGSGLALRSGAQIGIETLQDALPLRHAQALRVLIVLGMAALFVALAWYGADYAWRARFQMAAALEIPMSWIYLGMPVGCVLLALHLIFVARPYVLARQFVHDDGVDPDVAAAL